MGSALPPLYSFGIRRHLPSDGVNQLSQGHDTRTTSAFGHGSDRQPPVVPGVVTLARAVNGEQATATCLRAKIIIACFITVLSTHGKRTRTSRVHVRLIEPGLDRG